MKAKGYLDQLQVLELRIEQKKEMLENMRLQAESCGAIRYDKDKVQNSICGSPLEEQVIRRVDFEQKLNKEIARFAEVREIIIGQIQGLDNIKHIQILFKLYVQYKTLKESAEEMDLSYSYILELHKKALKNFDATYKNLSKYC
jgi:DNA-directed RNA polymerase specialized sigma subunit